MRTVYIDVLITVNVFVDFFLILCTQKILNIRAGLVRIILGSAAGGLLSLAALLPKIPAGINILIDIVFAVIIVFISFGKTSLRIFIKRVAVYFALSFTFCGIMIFIYTAFKPKGMEIYNDTVYFNISPLLLIILTLVCYYILKIIKRLTKGVCGKSTCIIEISVNNTSTSFIAAVDTGCNVKEPFSGYFAIIAEGEILRDLRLSNDKMRIIPFESLGGDGILKGYKADYVRIDGKELKCGVYLGVCENVLKGEIKALVPYELTKDN